MEMVGQLINGLLVLAILGCGVMLFVVTDSAIQQVSRHGVEDKMERRERERPRKDKE